MLLSRIKQYVGHQFLINKIYVFSAYFHDKYHICLNFIQSNNINWISYLYWFPVKQTQNLKLVIMLLLLLLRNF